MNDRKREPRPSSPRALERELDESRERFKVAMQLAGATLYGQDRDLGYTWAINPVAGSGEAHSEVSQEETLDPGAALVAPAKRLALETGEPQRVEFFRKTPDDGVRWFDLRIQPERDEAGEVSGIICAAIDITERKRWEEHQRVLLLELAHRSKNLLAVVQSIANQSGQNSSSIEEFKRRFLGRLQSLSRAHEILSDQNWRGAGMRELIRSQVLMYVGNAAERVRYEGPPVYLRPNAAQHVGLALHELTTNAMKYGALQGSHGQIEIAWSFDTKDGQGEVLTLKWEETPFKPASAPRTRNFGRILLEAVVPASVEGQASLEFGEAGVVYRLTIPSGELA